MLLHLGLMSNAICICKSTLVRSEHMHTLDVDDGFCKSYGRLIVK